MRRIAAVVLGTAALLGVLATPAQATNGGSLTDSLFFTVGGVWGGIAPQSVTEHAVDGALGASGR